MVLNMGMLHASSDIACVPCVSSHACASRAIHPCWLVLLVTRSKLWERSLSARWFRTSSYICSELRSLVLLLIEAAVHLLLVTFIVTRQTGDRSVGVFNILTGEDGGIESSITTPDQWIK